MELYLLFLFCNERESALHHFNGYCAILAIAYKRCKIQIHNIWKAFKKCSKKDGQINIHSVPS